MRRLTSERGISLLEVLIASAILLIVIVGFLAYQSGVFRTGEHVSQRRFAIARAVSILEELEAYVEGGSESHAALLDDFDDGTATTPLLTTQKEITTPDDPVSGNHRDGDHWFFHRRITVEKLTGVESRDVRLVQVTVFRQLGDRPDGRMLAQVSRVIRTIGSYLPPTQVVDVYALALENVPGWWVNMATIRPLVENAFNDMEAVNPGLEFRIHWITRLAYGRDPHYAPYVNSTKKASERVPYVYWYPGMIDDSGFVYYAAPRIGGRLNVDEGRINTESQLTYSLADQFNNAMRYPDEKEFFEARREAGLDSEPTLRLLLDEMATDSNRYRNALIVNLHGELLPLPPVRNYSDPARDPIAHPRVRAVTHPERLQVKGYDDIVLRVYAWTTQPDRTPRDAVLDEPITVRIKGVKAPDSTQVTRIGSTRTPVGGASVIADGRDTLVRLPRTPLRTGKERLYGWEYIPSPVDAGANFSKDLASGGEGPANTARWIIRIPGDVVGNRQVLTVETSLGQGTSRTFVWIDMDPPPSEKNQFVGDPRHMPYSDVKKRHGYNWYFQKPSAGYAGFDRATEGWAVDKVDIDVPRFFGLWRDALLGADTIFTTMNGFSFFYVGIGGELGSDEPNGYPDGLPLNDLPYGGSGNKTVFVSEIHHAMRVPASRRGGWYARYWLGDLYPDSAHDTWRKTGNLPTGPAGYTRKKYSEIKDFEFDRRKRTDRYGAGSFFNAAGRNGGGPFNHLFQNKNTARATTDGEKLGANYNLNTPPSMSAYRPFTLDAGVNHPPEWKLPEYSRNRLEARLRRELYDADRPRSATSSGLIEVRDGRAGSSAFFVMNGLSPAGVSGTAFMGRYAAITLMEGFMIAGESASGRGRVPQLPRIEITSPSEDQELINPQVIDVAWDTAWRRWDGQPYTRYYSETFKENVSVSYVVLYSLDGGATWLYAIDESPAKPGVRPDIRKLTGAATYQWDVAGLPAGDFLVRVEAYRQTIPLHYSYHVVRQNIRR